jgi:hypothetical protein
MQPCERLTACFSFAIAPGRKYTNRTLRGDYGFTAEGVLIGIPGLPAQAPFRSVGLAHFDGKGNLTWLEHTVVNGTLLEADWPAASGTYSVNANCTGTAMVNTPNSPVPLKLAFVVVKEGKEVRTVLDTNAIQLSIHQSRLSAS